VSSESFCNNTFYDDWTYGYQYDFSGEGTDDSGDHLPVTETSENFAERQSKSKCFD